MKLFIFGATGDLIKKKVFPALEEIKNLEIISLGRKDLDNDLFNSEYCINCSNELKNRLNYKKISFKDNFCKECIDLIDKDKINYFYVSLPPKMAYSIIKELIELKKQDYKIKILLEKPFGDSLKEAKNLNELIIKGGIKEDIYLSDHYLFKDEILNLNNLFLNNKTEDKINKNNLKKIEIVSLEKDGINQRVYYDEVGAIKDMVQSHLLNILFKIINLRSNNLNNIDFSDIKSSFKIKDVKIAQYKDYQKEIGKYSDTETYAKISGDLKITDKKKDKNCKKESIEIILETGKKLEKKEAWISLYYDRINKDFNKIELKDLKNPYIKMFNDFFNGNKENFPKISQSLITWELTEDILKYIKKKKLKLEKY
jgi:glucose-6-phosphate 1-dehydrogenase